MSVARRSRCIAAVAMAIGLISVAGAASAAPSSRATSGVPTTVAAAGRTPGSYEFVITASRMTASNLVYRGLAAVTSGAARLQVMHFTLSGVSLTGFAATSPCVEHGVTTVSIGAAQVASATSGVVIDATSIRMTLAGAVPLTFTGSLPPSPLAPLALPSPLVGTSVTIVATYLSAGHFAAPDSNTTLARC